jgi:hypothetical protein
LNQEDIKNLNSEFEIVIKNIPTKKIPGSDGVTAEFYHIFKIRTDTNAHQTIP